jgi:hypothetical protein
MIAPAPRPSSRGLLRLLAAALTVLPGACVGMMGDTGSANPFAGKWATADHAQIAFRNDTIVLMPPDGPPTPMTAAECNGAFRYRHGRMTKASLTSIAAAQPDVHQKLLDLLSRPDYPVIEIGCGRGTSTYVLLDDGHLIAIYRDRDVVGLDRLSRI